MFSLILVRVPHFLVPKRKYKMATWQHGSYSGLLHPKIKEFGPQGARPWCLPGSANGFPYLNFCTEKGYNRGLSLL